jgi:hypothetical protein
MGRILHLLLRHKNLCPLLPRDLQMSMFTISSPHVNLTPIFRNGTNLTPTSKAQKPLPSYASWFTNAYVHDKFTSWFTLKLIGGDIPKMQGWTQLLLHLMPLVLKMLPLTWRCALHSNIYNIDYQLIFQFNKYNSWFISMWKSFKVYHTRWKGPSHFCYPFLPYILILRKNNESKVVKYFKRTIF